MISELELLHFAMWHARCEIVRHASAESCILSVRLVSKLYEHMGVPVMPMVVAVKAVNRQWRECIDQGRDPEHDENAAAVHIRHEYERPEDWDHGPDAWPGGHIVLVARGRYLVDPSADQLSYPDMGIATTPHILDLGDRAEDFITGTETPAVLQTDDGAWIGYLPFPDDVSYTLSADWQQCIPGEPLFDRVYEQTIGLVDLVEGAESLPTYAELPTALRTGMRWERAHLHQAVRSGIELGEIPPTAAGITSFLIRVGVPEPERIGIEEHPEIQKIIRRNLAKQPQRVPKAL